MASASTDSRTVYFGYGSNLWKAQMRKRCPESRYLGIARLNDFRWIINDRGYANVVEIPAARRLDQKGKDEAARDVVWGLVYALTVSDEAKLDINEGVPDSYTKENLAVDFWSAKDGMPDTTGEPERKEMLVYIDRLRTEPDVPKREYVYRMNMGIADAVGEGMPRRYVEGVVRKFIPEALEEGGKEAEKLAMKQAERFEDEE